MDHSKFETGSPSFKSTRSTVHIELRSLIDTSRLTALTEVSLPASDLSPFKLQVRILENTCRAFQEDLK